MSLHTRCTYINADTNTMIGADWEFEESFADDRATLFRNCQREYGRCVSKMYRETPDGKDRVVGWVFQGKDEYSDNPGEFYTREVWVEVRNDREMQLSRLQESLLKLLSASWDLDGVEEKDFREIARRSFRAERSKVLASRLEQIGARIAEVVG